MKKITTLVFILILIQSTVWAYCYQLDPVAFNNCIQRENYNRQMLQMQQQQIFMQQQQMNQQRYMQQQQLDMQKKMMMQQQFYQQQMRPQQQNKNYHTGNFEIDYFNLRRDAMMGEAPYMTREEFAKTYYNYGY